MTAYLSMNDVTQAGGSVCPGDFAVVVQAQVNSAKAKISALAAALDKNESQIQKFQQTLASGGAAVAEISATQARLSSARGDAQETQNQITALNGMIAWQTSSYAKATWAQPILADAQKALVQLKAKLAKEQQRVQAIQKELGTKQTLLRAKIQSAEWEEVRKIFSQRGQIWRQMQGWILYMNHLNAILADCVVKA